MISKWIPLAMVSALFAGDLISAKAGLIVSDNAGNYSSWGSSAGSATQGAGSGSVGISGWTFSNTAGGSGSENGSFLGSSANINSGSGNAWGLYANGSQTADATATFSAGALQAGQQLSVQMQNNSIQNGGTVGISLRNSSGQNVLEFYFKGGESSYDLNVWQNASTGDEKSTTVGYTSGPLTLSFSQQSGNGWSLGIYEGDTLETTVDSSDDGNLWSGISEIRFFNFNAGSGDANNVYFNNLEVIPESAGWGMISAFGLLGIGGWREWRRQGSNRAS